MAALSVGLGVLAAACSNSPGPEALTTTTTHPHHSTSAETTAPPATTTTAGDNCQVAGLSVAAGESNGAAGTIEQQIIFTNTSSSTCTLEGYPGLEMLDSSGAAITTTVVRGQMNFLPATANNAPALVTLAPNDTAAFTLGFEDVPVGNETSCPTSTSLEVTPPNDVPFATISLQLDPCNNGTIHVSPVYSPVGSIN